MDQELLLEAAWKARENAYTPYSNFKIEAAVLGRTETSTPAATLKTPASA